MKLLIGLSNSRFEENSPYKMYIVDSEVISNFMNEEWKDIDINELSQCVNIQVNRDKFESALQNPREYISANFDIEKLIGYGRSEKDFQITNVYLDENGKPQLYKAINSHGDILIHDISELQYRKKYSVLGDTIENLPLFVKKEPLSKAYEWWKAKDASEKDNENMFFSNQFEVCESMPVRLLYHYLTGVKGFKVGYHTITEINENYLSEFHHEYMLFKDTANIKLRESIPKEENLNLRTNVYGLFGEVEDPYPKKRTIGYYGATMSIICTKENYPTFNHYHRPNTQSGYDNNGIEVCIDNRDGLINIYNKFENAKCISNEWRLGEYNDIFGMTLYNLLPEEIALLSSRLQSEKEGTVYGHAMSATHGHWSTFNTDRWIKVAGLALSMQFYSQELREKLNTIFQQYSVLYSSNLNKLINDMGAKDALEVMKWTKENSKKLLKNISLVKDANSLQKANVEVVDQMSNLFTFKKNNYQLPDWLQIYSPQTIESLGGVELLQKLIKTRGESEAKEIISILAEEIEIEIKHNLRNNVGNFVKDDNPLQNKNGEVVEQMNSSSTFKKNNYQLPEWLQVYSPKIIESLGGIELLQQLIKTRGESEAKEIISILAKGIQEETIDSNMKK